MTPETTIATPRIAAAPATTATIFDQVPYRQASAAATNGTSATIAKNGPSSAMDMPDAAPTINHHHRRGGEQQHAEHGDATVDRARAGDGCDRYRAGSGGGCGHRIPHPPWRRRGSATPDAHTVRARCAGLVTAAATSVGRRSQGSAGGRAAVFVTLRERSTR